jgi:hypothetical protein
MNKEKYIILAPGPIHLFWTTGIYYLWELSKRFKVILIVDYSYQESELFIEKLDLMDIAEIIYIPKFNRAYLQQRFYRREFARILMQYCPSFIFQHNSVYIENMYLFYIARILNLDCIRISYQTARMAMNWDEDFKARRSVKSNLGKKDSIKLTLMCFINKSRADIKRLINTFVTYYIVPFFIIGRPFVPLLNLHTGKFKYRGEKLRRSNRERYEFYLSYYSCEKRKIEELRGYNDDIIQIKHPLQTVGAELHNKIFNECKEDIISIFPTNAVANYLNIEKGISEDEVVKKLSNNWIDAIKILMKKFPNYRYVWKLHPGSEKDMMMQSITEYIKKNCQIIDILNIKENAQEWIIKSKVVVTDVSSVFWWANLLNDKRVISLDIFGYPAGDEAKYYDGVIYFNTLEALESFDFNSKKLGKNDLPLEVHSLSMLTEAILSNKNRADNI